MYKLGKEQQVCRLCGDDKEDSLYIVCHCPALACERYRTWSRMFLRPKDLEEVRKGSLMGALTNTRCGLVP
jgi:ferredoxin-thioredoxin reductase catalytic subunit